MVSQAADVGARWRRGGIPAEGWTAPDAGRRLQLVLAAIWLLDALLQFQAFMFSRGFAQLLGATAAGNPAIIADPITWSARIIAAHPTATNATFALIQLALGLGIAWRPTLKPALASSVVWSLAVWWFGEGLGGVLNGTASPVNGAPGAVIIYGLLAVLLWPPAQVQPAQIQATPFVAGRFTGAQVARALWLVLWGSLAYLAVLPATRAPKAFGGMVAQMASGEPGWLARTDDQLGAFLTRHGPAAAVLLAIALALVAVSVYLPRPAVRAGVVLALVTAAFLWIAQGLGGMLAGGGTDPESGPLLALVALAYWPLTQKPQKPQKPMPAPREPDMGGGPSWLAWIFAGVTLTTAVYCVARLLAAWRQHRPTDRHVDGIHVLMGVAMAGMLVPRLRVFWIGGWEVVFGAGAVWFAGLVLREHRGRPATGGRPGHHLQHVLACGAMLYMLLAVTGISGSAGTAAGTARAMDGMGGGSGGTAHFRTLALVLAFALFGYVVWNADRLSSLPPVAVLAARVVPLPVLAGVPAGGGDASAGGRGRSDDAGPSSAGQGQSVPLSLRLAACCEIAMGVTMGYMLILML